MHIPVDKQVMLAGSHKLSDQWMASLKLESLLLHQSLKKGSRLGFAHQVDHRRKPVIFFLIHDQPSLPPRIQKVCERFRDLGWLNFRCVIDERIARSIIAGQISFSVKKTLP